MSHPTDDPCRTLPPLPDGCLVRIRLIAVTHFLAAPFGPLTLPDCQITVETTIPELAPLEHHWKRTASQQAWLTASAFQPAGERIAEHSRQAVRTAATLACCLSPVALRLF